MITNPSRDTIAMAVIRGLQNIDNLKTDVALVIADDITDSIMLLLPNQPVPYPTEPGAWSTVIQKPEKSTS